MQSQWQRRTGAIFAASLFIIGLLTIIPSASATPGIPFCGPASIGAGSEPTADAAYDPAICEAITGRVFPEAFAQPEYFQPDDAGHANTGVATDFVSYYEFQQGLEYLAAAHPDYIEIHEVAESYGLCPHVDNAGLVDDPAGVECQVPLVKNPVYMLEITNQASPMPLEERQALLFMLSIHGNEKGGREGGMRVLEDLLKNIGFAAETVQDGAGMPTPLAKPTGGNVETYHDILDFTRVFLLFPNTDGWVHDEAEFASNPCHGYFPTMFCRTNGNGADLNRQGPTLGWQNPNRNVVGEPEAIGYYNWMLENDIDWTYAIDIHGMINHQNFGAIMLPAASMTPLEMEKSLGLAETLKQRLNNDPHFDEWMQLMTAAQQANEGAVNALGPALGPLHGAYEDNCGAVPPPPVGFLPDACFGSSLFPAGDESQAVGSSQFAEYYTVIDAIGYTDSGFNGDFFVQNNGLNAPGYDIELAYNHLASDSQYAGPGALWNDYHVKMVREITKSFMDAAALDISVRLETGGRSTLVLENPVVVTNLDDVDAAGNPAPNLPADSWAAQNDGDDLWQYSEENPFFARPHKYWEDMKPFVTDGDVPGVLNFQSGSGFTTQTLAAYDTFVVAGSAFDVFANDPAKVDEILAWVEAGGTLILTDSALQFLEASGLLADGTVEVVPQYMGGIKVAPYAGHELLKHVRGGVMQMYEPTPIGFGTSGSAPNWEVDQDAWTAIGGEIAGLRCGSTQLNNPACDSNGVGLGQVAHGEGKVRIMGSLLPDPTEEFYHPYGLDHYATTYSGNAIMLNMLGWDKIYSAPSVVITEDGKIVQTPNEQQSDDDGTSGNAPEKEKKGIPSIGAMFAVLVVGLAAWVARRQD